MPTFLADMLGLVCGPVQQLKDDSEYKRLAAQLKRKVLPIIREATMIEDCPGFALTPRGTPLPYRVVLGDRHPGFYPALHASRGACT